jgi:PAS domain S-box-containing protein
LEAVYLAVVEAYPNATIVIDSSGTILVFNLAAELLFGYSREEVLGKSLDVLIPEDRRAAHIKDREEYCREPRTMESDLDLECLRRNGERFPVQIRWAPMVVHSIGVCFVAVVRRIRAGQIRLPFDTDDGRGLDDFLPIRKEEAFLKVEGQ